MRLPRCVPPMHGDSPDVCLRFPVLSLREEIPPGIRKCRLKSDFFYRPGDKRHKTQKSKFEIFCPEIAHGMPIHLV